MQWSKWEGLSSNFDFPPNTRRTTCLKLSEQNKLVRWIIKMQGGKQEGLSSQTTCRKNKKFAISSFCEKHKQFHCVDLTDCIFSKYNWKCQIAVWKDLNVVQNILIYIQFVTNKTRNNNNKNVGQNYKKWPLAFCFK